jgi:hypothetical protein
MARTNNPFSLNFANPRVEVIPAIGGLDITTPPVLIPAGSLIAGVNFVAKQSGGYERIAGYERFDGSLSPSEATYFSVIVGQEIVNVPSSAAIGPDTFTILGVDGDEVFLYGEPSESVKIGATITLGTNAYTILEVVISGAQSLKRHAELRYAAAELRRQQITEVPGVGVVLGAIESPTGGVVAFRADSSGVIKAYRSSPSGWISVPFATQLQFKNGTASINVGDTITGDTSGATATVDEVIVVTGAFNATTPASGVLVLSNVTSTFQDGESLLVSSTSSAVAVGSQYTLALPPALDLNWVKHNFSGQSGGDVTYFVDGNTDVLYRYDGTRIVGASIGLLGNAALSQITAYKGRLYLSAAASLFISAPGYPFKYDAVDGAAEIAVGSEVTNVVIARGGQTSSAIVVTTDRSINVLYGDSEVDWRLQSLSNDIGAIKNTACLVNGDILFAANSGIFSVQAVNQYGNFAVNSVTQKVSSLYKELRPLIKRAYVRADASEYRVYCSDGRVLVATQTMTTTDSGATVKPLAFSVVSYKDYETESFVYSDVCKVVDSTGEERFFVSSDKYVYETDKGTSFDGAPIFAFLVTAFFHNNLVSVRKRYKRVIIAIKSNWYSEGSVMYDVSPSAYDGGMSRDLILSAYPQGAWYDVINYGNFVWSAGITPEYKLDTPGTGKAMSLMVKSVSSISDPFVVQSFTVTYMAGRLER